MINLDQALRHADDLIYLNLFLVLFVFFRKIISCYQDLKKKVRFIDFLLSLPVCLLKETMSSLKMDWSSLLFLVIQFFLLNILSLFLMSGIPRFQVLYFIFFSGILLFALVFGFRFPYSFIKKREGAFSLSDLVQHIFPILFFVVLKVSHNKVLKIPFLSEILSLFFILWPILFFLVMKSQLVEQRGPVRSSQVVAFSFFFLVLQYEVLGGIHTVLALFLATNCFSYFIFNFLLKKNLKQCTETWVKRVYFLFYVSVMLTLFLFLRGL